MRTYKVPLDLVAQPEGGFTVTSPALPELVTEGDTVGEALQNARDAFAAVLEIYEDDERPLPDDILEESDNGVIHTEQLLLA